MNKLYKFFGGRKMFLVLLTLVNGIILAYLGKLTYAFAGLAGTLNIAYVYGNSKTKEFIKEKIKRIRK